MPVNNLSQPPLSARHEGDLVDRFVQGDDRAAVELYERHGNILFSLALHIVSDRSDAIDIVEAVFQQVRTGVYHYETSLGSVENWLLQTTRLHAIEYLRNRCDSTQDSEMATAQLPRPTRHQKLEICSKEEVSRLRNLLIAMPKLQRLALELAYFEGFSARQIAEQLEHPIETIKEKVHEALLTLRATH
jgi:RNA polymerase sigma-70 factor (ECF subfamily)